MKCVTVGKSAIAGRGLFACETIRPGEEIAEYVGRRMTNKEFNIIFDAGMWMYAVSIPGGVIDAAGDEWDEYPAKFSNDAMGIKRVGARNNATFRYSGKRGNYKVYIVATRHIKPGDEIFTSYGRGYWNQFKKNERAGIK